jgi:hypothetical protein
MRASTIGGGGATTTYMRPLGAAHADSIRIEALITTMAAAIRPRPRKVIALPPEAPDI